ncbi:uncharacterized protein B0T23DRAFT_142667 [Neurospora hispaniola]|uniref:Uncharacterized protein n=1 Tax=Neurospora hispaniola TaxID=588809 RepID=A0AAJ0MRQ2_9PEZI|nr:hypothetical protein B0T23DRAFT_142667 [Neurospora hispaniola]
MLLLSGVTPRSPSPDLNLHLYWSLQRPDETHFCIFSHMFPVISIFSISLLLSISSNYLFVTFVCVGRMDRSVGGWLETKHGSGSGRMNEWDRKRQDGRERHAATIKLPGCRSRIEEASSSPAFTTIIYIMSHAYEENLPASERSWIGQYGCLRRRGGGFYHAVSAICDFNSTIYPFASYWDRVVGRLD